ncbi:hypothetical protein RJ640_006309 [Escallonia rubra]|uniref:Apple domain-containing protein n=1 Tax=Escallonia rubra TaxID=112253 RepID=A0AA88QZ01_9ASTE|nr:hypothetical protein RJ640_006309 [Escallonia rubra]
MVVLPNQIGKYEYQDCLVVIPNQKAGFAYQNLTSAKMRLSESKIVKVFKKYPGKKLPDTQNSSYNGNLTLNDCHKVCLENFSCMAYANSNTRNGGSGCLHWFGELLDVRDLTKNGQDLYIRVAASEIQIDLSFFIRLNSPPIRHQEKERRESHSRLAYSSMNSSARPGCRLVCLKQEETTAARGTTNVGR